MADTLKVLAQAFPLTAVLTDIYTVPGATSAAISSITICNQGASKTTFRLSIAVAGAVDIGKQYIYYDVTLAGHDSFILTGGITLAATDVVRGYSASGNVSFNIFGVEVS